MNGGNGFFQGVNNINEEKKFTSPRGGSFMIKKDSMSIEQNIDNPSSYIKSSNQPFFSSINSGTNSPINFSATNSVPFPGEGQINSLKRKLSETNMVSVMLSPSSHKPQSSNVAYVQNFSQHTSNVVQ